MKKTCPVNGKDITDCVARNRDKMRREIQEAPLSEDAKRVLKLREKKWLRG